MPFDAASPNPTFSKRQPLVAMEVDDLRIVKLQRNDRATQTEIFRQFEKPIYTFCFRILGQSADALDAMQDTFIQAFTNAKSYRGSATFGAWLRAIALNVCLKTIRNRSNWKMESSAALEEFEPTHASESAPASTTAIDAQIDLERALSTLSDQTRAVLWLHCVERYSHQEIADSFGLSLSFSKSCVSRGLQRLRNTADSSRSTL
jgi:RNA polymerase sigma factor (sigma-70 family)